MIKRTGISQIDYEHTECLHNGGHDFYSVPLNIAERYKKKGEETTVYRCGDCGYMMKEIDMKEIDDE